MSIFGWFFFFIIITVMGDFVEPTSATVLALFSCFIIEVFLVLRRNDIFYG